MVWRLMWPALAPAPRLQYRHYAEVQHRLLGSFTGFPDTASISETVMFRLTGLIWTGTVASRKTIDIHSLNQRQFRSYLQDKRRD